MPQVVPISLEDEESTPVVHVFTPSGETQNGGRRWTNNAVGIVEARESLLAHLSNGTRDRVLLRLAQPVVVTEVINGVSRSKVDGVNLVNIEYVFRKGSTHQERKNLRGMVEDLHNDDQAFVIGLVEDLSGMYS